MAPIESASRTGVPDASTVVLLGSSPAHLAWVRTACPHAERLDISAASIDAIADALRGRSFDHLVWIAPDADAAALPSDTGESLVADQEQGVVALFRTVKALLQCGYGRSRVQLSVVTANTQRVTGHERIQPAHAGVAGLIGSVAKEHPNWRIRVLDIDSLASATAQDCLSLPWDAQANTLAHRDTQWFTHEWSNVPALASTAPLYRDRGVYVVVGGAGGIGEVWTRFMIERFHATVIWIGRRPLDDSIQRRIDAIGRDGEAPVYIAADAADLSALDAARRSIVARYPVIHGVVHSAVALRDQSVARMDESALRATIVTKIDVSVNIDRVFGTDDLDFMLFFSSIVSFVRPAGQANYSAGCVFKDSFAHSLQQRRTYPIRIVNWGYWGSVGVAADEEHRRRLARVGLASIEPDEGMASLDALMNSDAHQMAVIRTARHQFSDDQHARDASSSTSAAVDRDGAAHVRRIIAEKLSVELGVNAGMIRNDAPLSDYGVDSILGVNLAKAIGEALHIDLDPASLFEFNTVDRCAEHILSQWPSAVADARAVAIAAATRPRSRHIHPLLHVNTSTLGQQSYTTTFSGDEFFLRDHRTAIAGDVRDRVLPEAVFLEMVHAAVQSAADIPAGSCAIELHDIVWADPCAECETAEVTVALMPADEGWLSFEVYSGEAGAGTVHCQGRATIVDRSVRQPVALRDLRKGNHDAALSREAVYAAFANMGLHYGPGLQPITAAHRRDNDLLATLALPAASGEDDEYRAYSLHPAIAAGAVQAAMCLAAADGEGRSVTVTVRSLRRVRVLAACEPEMFAWARHADDVDAAADRSLAVLDVDLLDTRGNVCVEMRGLTIEIDRTASGDATRDLETFLQHEAAVRLGRPADEIAVDRTYFDLGFSSPAITTFIGAINARLGDTVSPATLFDYKDIRSLADYLAVTWPAQVRAAAAAGSLAARQRTVRRRAIDLTPLPRKTYLQARVRAPRTDAASPVDMSSEQALEMVLWQDASLDESYEKVTF